jgi:hypothetical protein
VIVKPEEPPGKFARVLEAKRHPLIDDSFEQSGRRRHRRAEDRRGVDNSFRDRLGTEGFTEARMSSGCLAEAEALRERHFQFGRFR